MTLLNMASALDDTPQLSDETRSVHIDALNSSVLFMLSRSLDIPANSLSSSGNLKDFEGLSELMGFDKKDVAHFKMNEKTRSLLEAYGALGHDSSIGKLWDFLRELEREDILHDTTLIKGIENSVARYQERRQRLADSPPRAVRCQQVEYQLATPTTTVGGKDRYDHLDATADENHHVTLGEVETNEKEYFDAFVSYSDKDIVFVKELIRMLEECHNMKLCVNARDLVIGTSCHSVTAMLIAERCRKVLIIMSPSFLAEPECDFQIKFAHALSPGSRSKKMIPILIEPCTIPLILKHVTLVDHTKIDLMEWFYRRLAGSLRACSHADGSSILAPEDDMGGLEGTVYDFQHRPVRKEIQEDIQEEERQRGPEEQEEERRQRGPEQHEVSTDVLPGRQRVSSGSLSGRDTTSLTSSDGSYSPKLSLREPLRTPVENTEQLPPLPNLSPPTKTKAQTRTGIIGRLMKGKDKTSEKTKGKTKAKAKSKSRPKDNAED